MKISAFLGTILQDIQYTPAANWRSNEQQKIKMVSIKVTFSNCAFLIQEQINDAIKVKKFFFLVLSRFCDEISQLLSYCVLLTPSQFTFIDAIRFQPNGNYFLRS